MNLFRIKYESDSERYDIVTYNEWYCDRNIIMKIKINVNI